jgi:hypothetical protein
MVKALRRLVCSTLMVASFNAFTSLAVMASTITINSGYDLVVTKEATYHDDASNQCVTLYGLPLHDFVFPNGIGAKTVDWTDTIIQRTGSLTLSEGQSGTVSLNILAVSLTTNQSRSPNSPTDFYTTISMDTPSTGSMVITYNGLVGGVLGGSWTNVFDVYVDLHAGSPTGGVVVHNLHKQFSGTGLWTTTPTGMIVPGVNDNSMFYLSGDAIHVAPDACSGHTVDPVPEPGSIGLLLSGAGIAGFYRWRRVNRKSLPEEAVV